MWESVRESDMVLKFTSYWNLCASNLGTSCSSQADCYVLRVHMWMRQREGGKWSINYIYQCAVCGAIVQTTLGILTFVHLVQLASCIAC